MPVWIPPKLPRQAPWLYTRPTPQLDGIAASDYDVAVLADLPIAFWPLNELHGGQAFDVSGANRQATFVGTGLTYGLPGPDGGVETAVGFPGNTSNYVYVGDPYVSGLTNFTVEAWVQTTQTGGVTGSPIYQERSSGGLATLQFVQEQSSLGGRQLRFNYRVDSGTLDALTGFAPINTGAWVHVAVVKAGQNAQLYVNGVADKGATLVASGTFTTPNRRATIGVNLVDGVAWNGQIAKVALYSTALTATQIATHFTAADRSFVAVQTRLTPRKLGPRLAPWLYVRGNAPPHVPVVAAAGTADTSTTDDAVTVVGVAHSASTADSSTSTDAVTNGTFSPARATADTSASSDSAARTSGVAYSTADASASSDAVTRAPGFTRSTADSSLSSATATRAALAFTRHAADTSRTSDEQSFYDATVLADNPAAYWQLEETSGTSATDATGNAHDGTYQSTVAFTDTGPDGNPAPVFTPTGHVVASSGPVVAGLTNWTVEAYVKTTNSTGSKVIYSERPPTGNDELVVRQGSSAARLELIYRDDAGTLNTATSSSGASINSGDWVHVAVVKSGTAVTFYINGVSAGTATLTATDTLTSGTIQSWIAGDAADSAVYWPGSLARVAVHSTALTSGQIATHFAAGGAQGHGRKSNLTRSTADTSRSSDSASIAGSRGRSTADTSASSDTAARAQSFARTTADASTTSDAVSQQRGSTRSTADISASSDTATRAALARVRSTADASVSTDAAARLLAVARATADTSVSTDTASRISARSRSTADTSASNDAVSRALALSRSTADASVSADSATRTASHPRSIADASASSDTASQSHGLTRSTADSSTSSDTAARAVALIRAGADTSSSTDTATASARAFARSTTDTSRSADTATRSALSFVRATSDTSASTDSPTGLARFTRVTADTSATSDTASLHQPTGRATADTSSSSDTATRAVSSPVRSTADTSATTDVVSRIVVFQRSTADASASSDTASQRRAQLRSTADTSASSDAVTRGAQSLIRSTADSTTSTDTTARLAAYARAVVDTTLSSDAASTGGVTHAPFTADTTASSDTASRTVLTFTRFGGDSSTSLDAVARSAQFSRSTSDLSLTSDLAHQTTIHRRLRAGLLTSSTSSATLTSESTDAILTSTITAAELTSESAEAVMLTSTQRAAELVTELS